MRHRDVQRQPRQFRSRRYDIATRNLPARCRREVGEVGAGRGRTERIELPALDCRAQERVELRGNPFEVVVVVRPSALRSEHCAARVVQHGAALLIGGAHA